jgi:hypothetical protein
MYENSLRFEKRKPNGRLTPSEHPPIDLHGWTMAGFFDSEGRYYERIRCKASKGELWVTLNEERIAA